MQLGCNTVVFGSADLKTALTHVAWAGYQYVELAAIKGMCEHVRADGGTEQTQEIRTLLQEHNLQPTAMEAATTDPERLTLLFTLANELGIGIVNIGSGGTTGDEASTQQAIEHIGNLARLAGNHGV